MEDEGREYVYCIMLLCVSCPDKLSYISCLPTDLLTTRADKDHKELLDYEAPQDLRD